MTPLTWGLKDLPPEVLRKPLGQWIYGCGACQDSCPYKAKLKAGKTSIRGSEDGYREAIIAARVNEDGRVRAMVDRAAAKCL